MPRIRLTTLPKRKADFIEPMDCASVPNLIDGPEWVYEIKLNGYRAVAQMEFLEWTDSDRLRNSKFVGLRDDKDALSVVKERP